ncbi:hypothetical protein [Marinicauda sp. Alg238-R41]|uniref:hypothetical protein n=1 Tax=Marinicauda sp. Alg238-R41 TaxID=2993447 RepID=UPI0022E7F50B|nr:hypothetical protein [Marinicauda sp. Alg238-R41]
MTDLELISIERCAERLTAGGDQISRSALSRYVKNHGLVEKRRGREALVNFAKVRSHRANNFQRKVMRGEELTADVPPAAQATGTASEADSSPVLPGLGEPGDVDADKPAETDGQPDQADADNVAALDPRRRTHEAKAFREEMETAAVLGRTVPVDEVTAGMADAIAAMRQLAKATLRDAADRAAAELGVEATKIPLLRQHFQTYVRGVEERFAQECAKLERACSQSDAMPKESIADARARLDRVTAFALRTRGLRASSRRLEQVS